MTDPLTPGGYLRQQREAGGLTLPQLARLYAYNPLGAAAAEALLAEAEADVAILGTGVLDRLRERIVLNPDVYLTLVADRRRAAA